MKDLSPIEQEQQRLKEGPRWILPSGGANGAALVGMLGALEQSPEFHLPDEINGASTGAFVGVCIACGMTAEEIMDMLKAAPLDRIRFEDQDSPGHNRTIFEASLKQAILASVYVKVKYLRDPQMDHNAYLSERAKLMQETWSSFEELAIPLKKHENPTKTQQAKGLLIAMRAKPEAPTPTNRCWSGCITPIT